MKTEDLDILECIDRMISNGVIQGGDGCDSCEFYVERAAYTHNPDGSLNHASFCRLGRWRKFIK